MKINVKLDENAVMPTKAHIEDAGFDLFAPEDIEIPATKINPYNVKLKMSEFGRFHAVPEPEIGSTIIDTGVHMNIPVGFVGMIKSKSGLNMKHGIIADGVVDTNYTGSIKVKLYNLSDESYHFKKRR